jgi:hypothetical protein
LGQGYCVELLNRIHTKFTLYFSSISTIFLVFYMFILFFLEFLNQKEFLEMDNPMNSNDWLSARAHAASRAGGPQLLQAEGCGGMVAGLA